MEKSETYLHVKKLIENRLIVIRYKELVEMLKNLQVHGRITLEEYNGLLRVGEHLKWYD